MAIFATLLGAERQLQGPLRDVTWRTPSAIGPNDACSDMPSASIGA
jgi:aspartate carbamoyltransferase catalytic subunit